MTDNRKQLIAGLFIGIAATSLVATVFNYKSNISKDFPLWILAVGGLLAGVAFYWFRSRYKPFYGSFEVLFGWVTVMYLATSIRTGNFSFPQLVGGLYIIVRGFDNIQKGLSDRGVKTRWLRFFQDYRSSEEQAANKPQQITAAIRVKNATNVVKVCFLFILVGGLVSSFVVYRLDQKIQSELEQREQMLIAQSRQTPAPTPTSSATPFRTPAPTPTSSATPASSPPVPEPTPAHVSFAKNAVGGETQEGDFTWNAPENTEIVHVDIREIPNSDGIRSISIIKQSPTQFTAHYFARSDKTLFNTKNALLNVEFVVTLRNKTAKP